MFKACTSPGVSSVTLRAILPDLEQLAAQTGLITRQTPRFSAEGFLLTLLKAVSTGQASFSQMAASLGDSEVRTLSRQALHQRLKSPAITSLQCVLEEVTASRKILRSKSGKLPFRRILLEDATQFRMHPKNHRSFRAVANDSFPDARLIFTDSTVKAHQHAAGAPKKPATTELRDARGAN